MTDLDLGRILAEQAARHAVPGAALGVLCDGAVATACCGVADTSTDEPVTPETRFAVGSLAKTMVATAVVRLAEAGRLSLDDAVAKHVPELHTTQWAQQATVRDLLANSSRLPLRGELEFSGLPAEGDDVLATMAAAVATDERTPAFWSYSNVGWCVVGRVLEAVAGLVWEDAMQANLLAPFGMHQTTFVGRPVAEPRASGHQLTADGPLRIDGPWTPRSHAPAGTTLLSTVSDLLRFADRHVCDPSLETLRARHADIRIHGWFDAWCLGLARFECDGGHLWGWDGVISGQRAVLRLVPGRGAVVLLTNGSSGRAMFRSVFPEVMKTLFGISVPELRLEPSSQIAESLERFAGVYAWPDRWCEVTATERGLLLNGGLWSPEDADEPVEALPIDGRTFLVDEGDPDTPTVTFDAFDDSGRPAVLYQMLWGLPRVDRGAC